MELDFLMKIKPRQFNWDKREWYDNNKSDGSKMKDIPTAGFIAQELDSAQTSANSEWLNLVLKDNPEKWEATSGNLLPVVVKAVQELNEKNNQLDDKNDQLSDKLDQLNNKYDKLVSENEVINEENIKLKTEIESLKSVNEKVAKLEKIINELTSVKNVSLTENK